MLLVSVSCCIREMYLHAYFVLALISTWHVGVRAGDIGLVDDRFFWDNLLGRHVGECVFDAGTGCERNVDSGVSALKSNAGC